MIAESFFNKGTYVRRGLLAAAFAVSLLAPSSAAFAQECTQGNEIDSATKSAIDNTAIQFVQAGSRGDTATLQQSAIPAIAGSFGGIEAAVKRDQGQMGSQVAIRREYLLDASQATGRLERAEFFCGVYGATGHTSQSASFAIPGLDPGKYALVITNATGGKVPYMVTVILQQLQGQWKLAGYYPKPSEVNGHDALWWIQQARQYKHQGQLHNAWFYYVIFWDMYAPVDFMSSEQLDKRTQEIQASRPSDLPAESPVPLQATTPQGPKTYNIMQMFPVPENGKLSLVVKYQAADVSNTAQAFQDNTAVIKGLVTKYPELRNAFDGIVARATTPTGQDYGTLLAMKDIK